MEIDSRTVPVMGGGILGALEEAADAAHVGAVVLEALRKGWRDETLRLYARSAFAHAALAVWIAERSEAITAGQIRRIAEAVR